MSALPRLGPAPAVALLALAVLAACDDEPSALPADRPAESPSAFDAATAVLSTEPFCDKVDPTLVAGALGVAADKVVLVAERVADAERAGADDRARPGRVNSCTFGSGTGRLVVAVLPGRAEAAVQRRIDGLERDGCRVADDPWFGSPGAVAECERDGGRRSVAVLGVVGDGGFLCTSVVRGATEQRDATLEVCRDTLETVGIPG